MSFLDDVKRFDLKNKTALDFKVCLMTFETIRKELMRRYSYAVVHCDDCHKTYISMVSADGLSKVFSSPLMGGVPLSVLLSSNGIQDIVGVPAPPLFSGNCAYCGASGKTVNLEGSISAIECNPTVINQGLNDLIEYNVSVSAGGSPLGSRNSGKYCAMLVYKFSLHVLGLRSEPVYLAVYSRKERWNYITSGVAVCRFAASPTVSTSSGSPSTCFIFDLKTDPTNHLLCAGNRILTQIESLLLSK